MPSQTTERRAIPHARAQVRAEQRGQTKVITGYAAVFYRDGDPTTEYRPWPDIVERIFPGAFDAAMREDDVRGLVDHSPLALFGRHRPGDQQPTLRLSIDQVGLRYEADLPDTQLGRDLAVMLERRDLDASSFGFDVSSMAKRSDVTYREINGLVVREIRALELLDVGPCAYPAYPATTADVRSDERSRILAARDAWTRAKATPDDDEDLLLLATAGHFPSR